MKAPCTCINLAAQYLDDTAADYEQQVAKIKDLSNGRMSVHPADKIKAKTLAQHASLLRAHAVQVRQLRGNCLEQTNDNDTGSS